MAISTSIQSAIHQRYSCRNYASTLLNEDVQQAVTDYIQHLPAGPFQKPNRFQLIAATDQERSALRELGTYGFIKNPPAFIIGASEEGPLSLEDFGYRMEQIILQMTSLGLGTCWLGGTFTRSAFAQKMAASKREILPAVASLGFPSPENPQAGAFAKQAVIYRHRLAWDALFFDGRFGNSLTPENSGAYATPLEMVRLAPSASNRQPWRIIRQDKRWHFYLQRTLGYREMAINRFTGIADMQRIDMGIAMSHFELAARDCGLNGRWEIDEPAIEKPDTLISYIVSWNTD